MRFFSIVVMAALVMSAIGCPKPPMQGKMPDAPREADPPPKRVGVPLDPALHDQADKELSEALRSSDPMIRVHALEGIRDSNSLAHKNEILQAIGDKDPHVRFAAALAVGDMRIAEAHDALLAIAEDSSENVRVAVRYGLHQLGDARYSHELEKMAADPSALVRGNTAFVLGRMGEPSAMKLLTTLAQDHEAPVRQQAIEAMWRLGDTEALKDLVGLTMSSHPDDEMIGYMALAMPRNTKVRQHIRPGLVGEDSKGNDREKWALAVPLVAARAMGMLGSDEGFGIARKGSASVDPQLRMLSALAFGAIGRSDAQDDLKKLLADADPNVRVAAATGILQLKPPG